jgi:hypothetical protein
MGKKYDVLKLHKYGRKRNRTSNSVSTGGDDGGGRSMLLLLLMYYNIHLLFLF